MAPWLTVVGIGEDGFNGLGKNARRALLSASTVMGSQRQLDLLPVCMRAERQRWPSLFTHARAGASWQAGLCAGQWRSHAVRRGRQPGAHRSRR